MKKADASNAKQRQNLLKLDVRWPKPVAISLCISAQFPFFLSLEGFRLAFMAARGHGPVRRMRFLNLCRPPHIFFAVKSVC